MKNEKNTWQALLCELLLHGYAYQRGRIPAPPKKETSHSHSDRGKFVFYSLVLTALTKLARAVADDDVVDLGLVAVLLVEALLGILHKFSVEVVAHQIDGAAAEAATHDT